MRIMTPPAPNRRTARVVEGHVLWYDSSLKMMRRGTHLVTLVTEEIGLCEIQPGTELVLQLSEGRWHMTNSFPAL